MNIVKSLFNYIFLIIFSYIFIVACITFGKANIWSVIFAFVLILFLVFLSKKISRSIEFNYKIAWAIIFIISLVFLITMAFLLGVKSEWGVANWDFSKLYRTAYEYTHKMHYTNEYYARYPNNVFWVSFLILLIKIIEFFIGTISFTTFVNIATVISCLMIWFSLFFVHKTANFMWGGKKAFFVGLIGVCCLPLYLYSQFLYTDTPTILLVSVMLFLYVKVRKLDGVRKYIYCGIMGFLSMLIFSIKLTAFLVVVAIIIDSLTKISKAKTYLICMAIAILFAGISYILCSTLSNQFLYITEQEKEQLEFPPTHFVMMGLNKESNGGFKLEDVQYTANNQTYDARKNANIEEIKNRINNFGFVGFLNHTFVVKVVRSWACSDLGGTDYLGCSPRHKGSLFYNIFADDGKYNFLTIFYDNVYFILIYLGMLISVIFSIKNKNYSLNVFRLSLLGIFLFLSMWECNSRYLLVFTPILIILGSDGIFQLIHKRHTG